MQSPATGSIEITWKSSSRSRQSFELAVASADRKNVRGAFLLSDWLLLLYVTRRGIQLPHEFWTSGAIPRNRTGFGKARIA